MEIQGHPQYLVYRDGRVWSKKRNIFIKQHINTYGYYVVSIDYKTISIHRLLGIHFISNHQNKPCIDHIDRNRLNNNLTNLRWVSYHENSSNRGGQSTNTSGHKHIHFVKSRKSGWKFQKKTDGRGHSRYFATKRDAICYKFIFILKNRIKI